MDLYDPRYAQGEVLVKMVMHKPEEDLIGMYAWNLGDTAIEIMADHFGWEYLGRWERDDDIGLIKVPGGQEDAVVKRLESLSYIDWAERRSLEYEERMYRLEVITEMLEEIKEGTVQKVDNEGNGVQNSKFLKELIEVKDGLEAYIDFIKERIIQTKLQKLS